MVKKEEACRPKADDSDIIKGKVAYRWTQHERKQHITKQPPNLRQKKACPLT
jgi:hypothetical protein